jgi:hypothetical protein
MITVIENDIPGNPRMVYYKVTDDFGGDHRYGAVITVDPAFDAEAFKTVVEAKVAAMLAENEFNQLIE